MFKSSLFFAPGVVAGLAQSVLAIPVIAASTAPELPASLAKGIAG
jgi:hypothetical protein